MDHGDLARAIVLGERVAPAAVVASSVRCRGAWVRAHGVAGSLGGDADEPAAQLTTPFDLASVTKPVTALTLARLVRAGTLDWSSPLGALVPEARGTPSEHLPIELFLAHRAGLDGHRPLYAPLVSGLAVDRSAALHEAALARRSDCIGAPPDQGFPPLYSDLGYLLAGEAIARASRAPLDEVTAAEVLAPLGVEIGSARQLGARSPAFREDVAATETVAWRGGTIRGVVHDENAWALAGSGACGHAGAFGAAPALLRLGEAILDALHGRLGAFLTPAEVEPLVRPRAGGTLLAGFDGKSAEGSSAGSRFGPRTFGHLGFTGTSLWIDPDRELAGVLLTNRVHPTRSSDVIRRVRPRVYDALADWADAVLAR